MSTTIGEIVDRVNSLLAAAPFEFVQSQSPFDFDHQPNGAIDKCYRVLNGGSNRTVPGFRFSETRIDRVVVYVARRFDADPTQAERLLTMDASSIVAAICRDGESVVGEYCLEDGRTFDVRTDPGANHAVLQVTVPVNYETTL